MREWGLLEQSCVASKLLRRMISPTLSSTRFAHLPHRNFSSIFGLWFFWMCILSYLPDGIPDYIRYKFSLAFELSMIFSAQLILVIMYNPKLSANFPFHSNATHEIMTGKFNKESFRKELEGIKRR